MGLGDERRVRSGALLPIVLTEIAACWFEVKATSFPSGDQSGVRCAPPLKVSRVFRLLVRSWTQMVAMAVFRSVVASFLFVRRKIQIVELALFADRPSFLPLRSYQVRISVPEAVPDA